MRAATFFALLFRRELHFPVLCRVPAHQLQPTARRQGGVRLCRLPAALEHRSGCGVLCAGQLGAQHRALPAVFRIQAQCARLAVQNGGDILLQLRVALGGGGVLAVPLFKKHRELSAQFNKQILRAGGALHHQRQILLLHIVKVRVIPCVHGDLLPAEQHQQFSLLFSGIKIALRAVPICVHRCSSVYPLCGQNFKLSARCRLRAFPLRHGPSVPFWRSRARGRRGPSL